MTLYPLMFLIHLLAAVVWVGGMAFVLFCLRPAAIAVLPPPQRIPLMHAALGRFFKIVVMAIALLLATGGAMIFTVGAKNMPVAWMWMVGLGVVMMSVFFHLRAVPFPAWVNVWKHRTGPSPQANLNGFVWVCY